MSESKIAVKPRAPISMKELRRMFASGLTMKDKPSNDENDSDDESSESESDSDAENQSDSDEDSKCDMKDDKEEKKKSSKSNSKDEVSEQRVPLKPVESLSLEEFEPVNEFGVRIPLEDNNLAVSKELSCSNTSYLKFDNNFFFSSLSSFISHF